MTYSTNLTKPSSKQEISSKDSLSVPEYLQSNKTGKHRHQQIKTIVGTKEETGPSQDHQRPILALDKVLPSLKLV